MLQINGKDWNELNSNDIRDSLNNIEESFYFEFKEDDVKNGKLVEEISAFANTYGGYIFMGVSDDREIVGCPNWNEERITNILYDSISPVPIFDLKCFVFEDERKVLVIRIMEGPEPPYITNKGHIYERISSESRKVTDSVRLSQMFQKRLDQEKLIEEKITIKDIAETINNLYGYIDHGFELTLRNKEELIKRFYQIDVDEVVCKLKKNNNPVSICRVGQSIVVTFLELYTLKKADGTRTSLPAHANSFMEIMKDGSARFRLLLNNNLTNDQENDNNISMTLAITASTLFCDTYRFIFKDMIATNFIYAKGFSRIHVIKQFHPTVIYDEYLYGNDAFFKDQNLKYIKNLREHIVKSGRDIVITDDRIPKTGLFLLDKRKLESIGHEFNEENLLYDLFWPDFLKLGALP